MRSFFCLASKVSLSYRAAPHRRSVAFIYVDEVLAYTWLPFKPRSNTLTPFHFPNLISFSFKGKSQPCRLFISPFEYDWIEEKSSKKERENGSGLGKMMRITLFYPLLDLVGTRPTATAFPFHHLPQALTETSMALSVRPIACL